MVLAIRAGRVAVAVGAAGLEEVLAGVRLIRRTKVPPGAISLDLFAVLLGGAVALLPIFAKDILEVGPTGLGSILRPDIELSLVKGHSLQMLLTLVA